MSTDTVCQASVDAAESVLVYLGEIRKRKSYLTLHEWLFMALAKKTKELASENVASEDLIFDPEDLVEWLVNHAEKKIAADRESASDYISGKFSSLVKSLKDDVRLKDIALEEQLTCYGKPAKKLGGGKGNRNEYYLEPVALSEEESMAFSAAQAAYPLPDNGLRYHEQKQRRGPLIARLLDGVDVKGWRLWLFLSLVIVPLLIFSGVMLSPTLAMFLPTLAAPLGGFMVWGAAFLGVFFALFGFIFRLVDKRIAMLPDWVSLSADYWLLEYRPTKDDAGEYSHRKIALVHYIADCPVCSGVVTVGKGGWHFPGRLVGRCNENPVEHIFSFDHVTRVGKPLR